MAQLPEDLFTRTAATLTFLPYRALICYLVRLPKEAVAPYHFSSATWQYVLCFRGSNRMQQIRESLCWSRTRATFTFYSALKNTPFTFVQFYMSLLYALQRETTVSKTFWLTSSKVSQDSNPQRPATPIVSGSPSHKMCIFKKKKNTLQKR